MFLVALAPAASGHAPIDTEDEKSAIENAVVINDPLKSWVLYEEFGEENEVHYYSLELNGGDELRAMLFIPIEEGENEFVPGLVAMGPGLSPSGSAPSYIEVPNGSAVLNPGSSLPERPDYEPFTPASQYFVAEISAIVSEDGKYYLAVYSGNDTGRYGMAVGYEERFTAVEWITVPFDVIKIHVWEGQNILVQLIPLLVVFFAGLYQFFRQSPDALQDYYQVLGIKSSLLFFGGAAMVAMQTGIAASHALSASIIVTIIFIIVPALIGLAVLKKAFAERSRKNGVILIVLGILGIIAWGGLIIGPLLAIISAIPHFKEKQ